MKILLSALRHQFKRALGSAQRTREFSSFDDHVRHSVVNALAEIGCKSECLFLSLADKDQWVVLTTNELCWREADKTVSRLTYASIDDAAIDLRDNYRLKGFDENLHRGIITVRTAGEDKYIRVEPGQGAFAMLAALTRLVM